MFNFFKFIKNFKYNYLFLVLLTYIFQMENENNEKKNHELKTQENKNFNNLDENNEPIIKEKNNIKTTENNDNEVKTNTKIKINELLNKDKKLKEIFQLINSPINSIKKRNVELSKDKIQNFLNDSSYYESSVKREKNTSSSNNKNKYKEVYDQINIIDTLNATKKEKTLIPYSEFKVKTIKFQPVKKVQNIKNYKSFSNKNKKDDIFSGLILPEKKEWITNTLFKSSNIFQNQKKDIFDLYNKNKLNFGKDEVKLSNYYKTELNLFGEMLKKGNSTNSLLTTPKNKISFLGTDFTKKFEKNTILDKLNKL